MMASRPSTPSARSIQSAHEPVLLGATSNVRVAIRVRPLNKREIEKNSKCLISMPSEHTCTVTPPGTSPLKHAKSHYSLQATRASSPSPTKARSRAGTPVGGRPSSAGGDWDSGKTFTFDHCLWSVDSADEGYAGQEKLYEVLGEEFLNHSLEGYNCCIFAYGQTGSGKTHSMMGTPASPGLIPRITSNLFDSITQFSTPEDTCTVHISYFEIYNEQVRDLLAAQPQTFSSPDTKNPTGGLRVRERKDGSVFVEGLNEFQCKGFEDVLAFMKVGNKVRTTAATLMNDTSSRSHAVFTICLRRFIKGATTETTVEKISRFRLVDLAGSERASTSGATGTRLREGGNINKSLTTLGRVIASLADVEAAELKGQRKKEVVIPYRDSVLTYLLRDSLGGNSKTAMIACISPADINYEETMSTLRYADAAKRIKTRAIVNQTSDISALELEMLRKQLRELEEKVKANEATKVEGDKRELEIWKAGVGKLEKVVKDISDAADSSLLRVRVRTLMVDERITKLESENEALRTHLRLALETIRDPIPETLYLQPDDEEKDLNEEWGEDMFERFDEWDDCWAILGQEAEGLAAEVRKWRGDVEKDFKTWPIQGNAASGMSVVEVVG